MKNTLKKGLMSQMTTVTAPDGFMQNFYSAMKDWQDEDFESHAWAGNGIPVLPTVQFYRGGTVMFLTSAQAEELNEIADLSKSDGTLLERVESAFGEENLFLKDIDIFWIVDAEETDPEAEGYLVDEFHEALDAEGLYIPVWSDSSVGAYMATGGDEDEEGFISEVWTAGRHRLLSMFYVGWEEGHYEEEELFHCLTYWSNSMVATGLLVKAVIDGERNTFPLSPIEK